jgi:hypothetical protein
VASRHSCVHLQRRIYSSVSTSLESLNCSPVMVGSLLSAVGIVATKLLGESGSIMAISAARDASGSEPVQLDALDTPMHRWRRSGIEADNARPR